MASAQIVAIDRRLVRQDGPHHHAVVMHGWTLAGLVLLILLAMQVSLAAEDPTGLERAEAALAEAQRAVRPRGVVHDILEALDEAEARLLLMKPPPRPALLPVDPDAGQARVDEVSTENARRMKAWLASIAAFRKQAERLRGDWVKILGDAMALEKCHPQVEINEYDEVNRHALGRLVASGHPDAPRNIVKVLDSRFARTRDLSYSGGLAAEAFTALPGLGSVEVLDWLRRKVVCRPREIPFAIVMRRVAPDKQASETIDVALLALQAVAAHENVDGDLRYKLVRELIATYEPLETKAGRGTDTQTWDRLGEAAIEATWKMAGEPRGANGFPLSTMARLSAWFAKHKNPRKPPWRK